MFSKLTKIFTSGKEKKLRLIVSAVNSLEHRFEKVADAELASHSQNLRERLNSDTATKEDILPEAFALVREAAKRTLKQRHFDTQIMSGIVLHQGKIAEMFTGEGKTLAATLPAYLNALVGKGVHVVTVNDYLAKRDAVWMGQIYNLLGISVSCIAHDASYVYDPNYKPEAEAEDQERDQLGSFKVFEDFLRPVDRREAYLADITYGTNHEFGFDYLRDNLVYRISDKVQRGHYYAIIDEVDSILIDEARTPLIIAAPDRESSEYYRVFARIVEKLQPETDYLVEEKKKSVNLTEDGITKVENLLNIKNLFEAENLRLVHYLQESLRAKALYRRDKEYVVKNGEVIIVDEFTGRMLPGRRYSGGLHQAIEAKEGVAVKQENRTYAQITIQNYFRLYKKIAGMTGTAQTSAEEFHKVYNLEVVSIPPNKPLARKDLSDLVYKTEVAKYQALVEDVKRRRGKGQPVLIGTPSIEKNEILGAFLKEAGIPHEVLNAKNHEREGAIIAQAGRSGAVTVATNMAGRGVDIILGGNPPDIIEAEKVKNIGGLHIIGTARHEARRIDNQLRGRAGRQGDPGSSQFYLSLEDDLMRIFGGERLQRFMTMLKVPDDMPIESKSVSKMINQAQGKVEGFNFDIRKHLLDYDDVLNRQRTAFYAERQNILEAISQKTLSDFVKEKVNQHLTDTIEALEQFPSVTDWPFEQIEATLKEGKLLKVDEKDFSELKEKLLKEEKQFAKEELKEFIEKFVSKKMEKPLEDSVAEILGLRVLRTFDLFWMGQLENLEALHESVRIRAYGQHDPLIEYRREAHRLYKEMMASFNRMLFVSALQAFDEPTPVSAVGGTQPVVPSRKNLEQAAGKIGRNDPCYCGSGKKYKKCHGK